MKIRILEHHKWVDKIRIGASTNIDQSDMTHFIQRVMSAYATQHKASLGQLCEEFEKYYKSIRIVDANDFKTIRVIYEENPTTRESEASRAKVAQDLGQ